MNGPAFLVFAAAALAGSAAAAAAESPEEEDRTVQFELREGDHLVARPSVTVRMGRPTAISVGNYSMRLRVTRANSTTGEPAPYVVRSSLYRSGSGWTLVASPAIMVAEGEQARLRIAGNDGSDLSLAVQVR